MKLIVLTKKTEKKPPCEKYQNILTEATSSGFVDYQKQFDIILVSETKDEDRINLEKQYERQNEGYCEFYFDQLNAAYWSSLVVTVSND